MSSTERAASRRITEEVTRRGPEWRSDPDGASARAFRVGRREIGHLHGDRVAHFGFPKQVWAELMAEGRIVPHPVFPEPRGPAARAIRDEADVRDVIALLRLNYDRAVARHGLPAASGPG